MTSAISTSSLAPASSSSSAPSTPQVTPIGVSSGVSSVSAEHVAVPFDKSIHLPAGHGTVTTIESGGKTWVVPSNATGPWIVSYDGPPKYEGKK